MPSVDEEFQPGLPGLEAIPVLELVSLLNLLPLVLKAAREAADMAFCQDDDDVNRDDAAARTLENALSEVGQLRASLWRRAFSLPRSPAHVEIVRYVGLWGNTGVTPEVLWLVRAVGMNKRTVLADATCHHGLRDVDQAYTLAQRWHGLTGWPVVWKDAGDAEIDVPRTVTAGDNPLMDRGRVDALLKAIGERLATLRARQGGKAGPRLDVIKEGARS